MAHGAQVFISDVRACQNREQETKRVDKELAKIRKKFSSDKGSLSGECSIGMHPPCAVRAPAAPLTPFSSPHSTACPGMHAACTSPLVPHHTLP